jgi:hypothetical protein
MAYLRSRTAMSYWSHMNPPRFNVPITYTR